MEKLKNEQELFDLFVEGKDGLRDALKTPFIDKTDGRVWASDGRGVIMVNLECVKRKYEERDMSKGKIPVRDYNCSFIVDVAELERAIDSLPKYPEVEKCSKVCPECHGSGYVYTTYTASSNGKWYDDIKTECPVCDGCGEFEAEGQETGRMIHDENSKIKIGENKFFCDYIEKVIAACKKFGVTQIRLVSELPDLSNFALSDDVHIALSPFRGKELVHDAEVALRSE